MTKRSVWVCLLLLGLCSTSMATEFLVVKKWFNSGSCQGDPEFLGWKPFDNCWAQPCNPLSATTASRQECTLEAEPPSGPLYVEVRDYRGTDCTGVFEQAIAVMAGQCVKDGESYIRVSCLGMFNDLVLYETCSDAACTECTDMYYPSDECNSTADQTRRLVHCPYTFVGSSLFWIILGSILGLIFCACTANLFFKQGRPRWLGCRAH